MKIEEWLGEENKLGIDIWNKKYRYNNESFDEWLERVSGGNKEVKDLIIQKKFLFGGRVLSNRGTKNKASYFNCYSRGFVNDDYKDIMNAAVDIWLTFKSQGGQGISLTKLRPKGAPIGDEYTSDGIVPFMKIYNEVTEGTSQGGSRKGALMLSIDARHKEAETFIKIKSQDGVIEKANLSLEIDDEFMNAVKKYYQDGEIVTLHEHRDYSGHEINYDIIPINIFNALVDNCYDWGDPACLFVNRFRNYNIMEFDDGYNIETSNPCGEQPLPKHGACCLSSLNLSEFVKNPYTEKAEFDFNEFIPAVHIAIRVLDSLIDENYNRHPLKEQREMSFNYRNIGLGCFGYATALMKMGLKYGSDEAIYITDGIFNTLFREAVIESNNLARQYGSYPKYKKCVWNSSIIKEHFTENEIDKMMNDGLRNCSLISIAPNGSLATFINESGGCEPEYAIQYTRRTVGMTENEDKYYTVYCKAAKEYINKYHNKELPSYFIGSADIPWKDRVRTQAIMQQHVDTAISSTVNLPQSATKDDIANIYLESWEQGLKGVTIFRDGCKRIGILSTTDTQEEESNDDSISTYSDINSTPRGTIMEVPQDRTYKKYKLSTGCGKLYFFVGYDENDGKIYDCFTNTNGAGGCTINTQAVSRLLSACIRGGVPMDYIIKQLQSAGTCPSFQYARGKGKTLSKGSSCPSAIGYVLQSIVDEFQKEKDEESIIENDNNEDVNIDKDENVIEAKSSLTIDGKQICPECGSLLIHEGGCVRCSCGWSRCG